MNNEECSSSPLDECYRCGYDLRGIDDEQACPECGLLAKRSRRATDELHYTRPRWLGSISWGVKLILGAPLLAWGGLFLSSFVVPGTIQPHVALGGFCFLALLFLAGVWLLTRREGFPAADRADRCLRFWLRIAATAPILAVALFSLYIELEMRFYSHYRFPYRSPANLERLAWTAFFVATVGMVPLPLLLFRHLRSLARRARSAHLAEHCTIAGVGTSATFLYLAIFAELANDPEGWGLERDWMTRSKISLLLSLIMGVAATLFLIWGAYLLVRFAVAFHMAARKLRAQWRRDDRSDAEFTVTQ